MVPPQSAGSLAAGKKEVGKELEKEPETTYAFAAETILAREDASGDAVV